MTELPLWTPSAEKIDNSHLKKFMSQCGHGDMNYHKFWQWSVENLEDFWNLYWDYAGIIGDKGDIVLDHPDKMIGGQYFPNGKINYAENMLKKRDDQIAIITTNEQGTERTLTYAQLYDQVSLWRQALEDYGVKEGDRVAGYLPNLPETIIACLATTSLGAIWSSASPDFGAQGIIDRFAQIEPKVFIAVDGYFYAGKKIDCLDNVKAIQPHLKNLNQTIIIPFLNDDSDVAWLENALTSHEALQKFKPTDIDFNRVNFNHPLFIMFSSGTTGKPKCIVHGHGGTLLQLMKEHQLQCDFKSGDPLFYYTTCGWMMWNWLITGLGNGATLLLYDGSPFHPKKYGLWDYVSAHKGVLFGTAAKYIEAMKKHKIHVEDTHDLSALKVITSTGSPLVHENFDFVHQHIKNDVHLASISGGTDIVSCFMIGNPISPVYRGELQGAGLGLAVDIFNDDGKAIPAGAGSGELVCTKPFPCMPVKFWNDADGTKYKAAYFDQFDNIWAHGDWVERTENNGFIIHGRSDATLNPGGVRIGTAEIYRQVEKIDDVLESVAVGQNINGDVRIILFVVLRDNVTLTDDLKKLIRKQIKDGASPRHVPGKIVQVNDIPRTKSGKITELAIRDIIHNRPIKNVEALANPESLEIYRNIAL